MNEEIFNAEGFKDYINIKDYLESFYREYNNLYYKHRELLKAVNDFIETDASGIGIQETVIKFETLKKLVSNS